MKKIFMMLCLVSFTAAACNTSLATLRHDKVLGIKTRKLSVQVADSPQSRAAGLSGLKSMSEEEGMLFLFSEPSQPQFWMKDMLFPIDIIWINGNKIVGITDNIKAEPGRSDAELSRYSSPFPADKVLEVNAGWTFRKDVNVGDTVTGF
jgi:uncharacterized membrane protein (UPF0127 family)